MKNVNGHGVTSALPDSADAVQVRGVKLAFQQSPTTQSGGAGGPKVEQAAKGRKAPGNTNYPNTRGKNPTGNRAYSGN